MIQLVAHLARQGFALDVALESGSRVTGVFGPSGAGKTTLINLIAGLERPDRGRIVISGPSGGEAGQRILFDSELEIDVPPHRRRVGVVFQEHRLFPHRSVKGNLLFGRAAGKHHDGEVRAMIDLLELGPLLGRRVTELSGGERQRVAIGRAVLSQPDVLLLDEPLASLDVRLRQQIISSLQRLRDASLIPMLYVSHDLGELLQLTDQLLLLDHGRMVGHGRYADLVHEAPVLSLLRDRGMCNVVTGRLLRHEPEEGVSVVQMGATGDPRRQLIVPRMDAPLGERMQLSIHPSDIALALEPVAAVSIQNQIPGVVSRITTHERGALVALEIGAESGVLLVEVSRRSATALQLDVGRALVCLIKSSAIRRQSGR